MVRNNDESQTGPHPISRTRINLEIPMFHFREQLEALHPRDGNGSRSQVDETSPSAGAELTNLLLLELLQKQGEQLQRLNKHMQKLMRLGTGRMRRITPIRSRDM